MAHFIYVQMDGPRAFTTVNKANARHWCTLQSVGLALFMLASCVIVVIGWELLLSVALAK